MGPKTQTWGAGGKKQANNILISMKCWFFDRDAYNLDGGFNSFENISQNGNFPR